MDRVDAVAILGLSVVLLTRWWRYLLWRGPLVDEGVYLKAFEAVSGGRSPYEVGGYFYSPAFAELGAYLLRWLGEGGVLFLLRSATLVGLSVAVWLSLARWPTTRARRFLIAAVYLTIAPAVQLSLVFGNISFVVIGLALVALTVWPTRPGFAGVLLGLSVGIKPLAPMAILALGVHRPTCKGRAHWIAAGIATSITAGVLLPPSRLLEMTSRPITGHAYFRTISLHRILSLVGLEVSPLQGAILVAMITVVLCLLIRMTVDEILCVAATAAVLAAPVIWSHTLLLVLPVQVIALDRARSRRVGPSPLRRYELWLVILAIAALQFSRGAGLVDLMAAPFQIVALAVPYLAAPALTAYILITGRYERNLSTILDSQ